MSLAVQFQGAQVNSQVVKVFIPGHGHEDLEHLSVVLNQLVIGI